MTYYPADLLEEIETGGSPTTFMPALAAAKRDAYVALAKGRMALRPVNTGVIKATEADRSIEMEGKTAQLKADWQYLQDLWDLGMALIK